MIFVVTGTHTHGFDRLVQLADTVAPDTGQEWMAQIGASTYVPANMEWFRFCPTSEFSEYLERSATVVTHGGYTIVEGVTAGKRVIAVPRRRAFGEALDDHQVEFVESLADQGLLAMVETAEEMLNALSEAPLASRQAYAEHLERRRRLRSYVRDLLANNRVTPPEWGCE